jgi:hypothetical protein
MPEDKEQKLGPNVTWNPGEEYKQPMTMYGVQFTPGKAVNVGDALGSVASEAVLKKLAGNRYFKVDGGPDWDAEEQKKAKALEQADRDAEQARKDAEEQPADWTGPEKASLEHDSGARRPNIGKGKKDDE